LGSGIYAPAGALHQLLANALDANASVVEVLLRENSLEAVDVVVIKDDGIGMTEHEVDQNFRHVGAHYARDTDGQTIGSKGLGRFAVFALGYRASWKTVAKQGEELIEQSWVMTRERPAPAEIASRVLPSGSPTGTEITIDIDPVQTVVQSFLSSEPQVRRSIFYAFAPRLAVAKGELDLKVNGVTIELGDYVDEQEEERIAESSALPEAHLVHLLVNARVQTPHPRTLLLTQSGATVSEVEVDGDSISGRRYIGVLRSLYLDQTRTATDKRSFIEDDERLPALIAAASDRARGFIARQVATEQKSFIERARAMDGYPYRDSPQSQIERFEQTLYEDVLTAINESMGIEDAAPKHLRLILQMAHRLVRGEDDLPEVLTHLLGLSGPEVARLAEVLRRTTLRSLVTVAGLVLDRVSFLDELDVILYGKPAAKLKERMQLQQIIAAHSWLFGEQFTLITSDKRLSSVVAEAREKLNLGSEQEDADHTVDVGTYLRDVPDFYLAANRKVQGADYFQHLIVEMKRPSVRIGRGHVDQLKRYADAIVGHPIWGGAPETHKFRFLLVSSEVSPEILREYQDDEDFGLVSRPRGYAHEVEMFAVQWADLLNDRRSELAYLQLQVESTSDPELLEYLRSAVPDLREPLPHSE